MRGCIRRCEATGTMRPVLADAKWQNLNDTILGNPRKKPEWIINFSISQIAGGSTNNRMSREQAAALVSVLTRLLETKPEEQREFIEFEPEAGEGK